MAVAALRLCQAMSCPRAPALQIVTRSDPCGRNSAGGGDNKSLYTVHTTEDMADKLNAVREDEQRSKLREEEIEAVKAEAKAEQQQEQPTPRKKMKSSTTVKEKSPEPPSSSNAPNQSEKESVGEFKSASGSGATAVVDEQGHAEIAEPTGEPKEESSEDEKTTIESSKDRSKAQVPSTKDVDSAENSDHDEGFPMIVDCGPDGEDGE